MVDIICALCEGKQQRKILFAATFKDSHLSPLVYSARRKPDRVHYQISKCRRCGLLFSSPILPQMQIAKLYRESVCTYEEQIPYATKTYMALFERAISNLGNLRTLEIGCGNGFFLKALIRRGYKSVFGVEPSKKMVAQAHLLRKRIIADTFKRGQFPKNSFDIICTFHTLDHVVDIKTFMSEVFSLLRKGGVFLAVVHDVEGLSVKLLGERSPIFDIEHIYLFNKKTIALLCKKFGFVDISVHDVTNTYPLSYWWRVTGLPNVLGPFGRIPVTLKAGNIAVVARKLT